MSGAIKRSLNTVQILIFSETKRTNTFPTVRLRDPESVGNLKLIGIINPYGSILHN